MHDNPVEWVVLAKQGDLKAFEKLVEGYKRQIFSLCLCKTRRKADAEDLLQEVFWRAYDKLYTLKDDRKFFSWLYTIAINTVRSFLRSSARKKTESDEDYQESISWSDKGMLSVEDKMSLMDAMEELKEEDRLLLQWKYLEDWSLKEIAEVLDITENNTKVKLFRARDRLAGILQGGSQ